LPFISDGGPFHEPPLRPAKEISCFCDLIASLPKPTYLQTFFKVNP
jgi:hypothetical protein